MTKLIEFFTAEDVTDRDEAHVFIRSILTSFNFVEMDVSTVGFAKEYIAQNIDYVFRSPRPDAEKGVMLMNAPYDTSGKGINKGCITAVKANLRTYYESTYTPEQRIAASLNRLANLETIA